MKTIKIWFLSRLMLVFTL